MGLFAKYFFVDSDVTRLNQINFGGAAADTEIVSELNTSRSAGSFWDGGSSDYFAAQYTGNLNVDRGGSYTFYLNSDDGSALYIDGQRVINNDGLHADREQTVTLNLSRGAHTIEVRYFEAWGDATLQLEWAGPDSGGSRQVIGGDALTPVDPDGDGGDMQGLQASYFFLQPGVTRLTEIDFDAAPASTGMVSEINVEATYDPLWQGGPINNFAVRYEGNLNVETGGTYTFYLASDDGSALYIDGERVINNDGRHRLREQEVTLDLTAGEHDIEVRYFEGMGAAAVQLEWAGPDSNGVREVVNGSALSHEHSDGGHGDGGDDGGHDGGGDGGHGDGGTDDGLPGFHGDYYYIEPGVRNLTEIDFDATPDGTGMTSELNTGATHGSFWDGGPVNNFAARYTGNLNIETGGSYTFYLASDGGSALYIDGQRVINNDGRHRLREEEVTLNLSSGEHDIEVRYFEGVGVAELQLDWEGPDSGGTREVLSGDALSQGDGGHDDGGHDDGGDGGHDDGGDGGHDGGGDGGHDDGGDGGGDGGHDDGGDGGHGGGGHDDHSDDYIPPPTNPSEVEAYVAAVRALPDAHAHGDDPSKAGEHMQLLDLVERSEATHVAIGSGDWFDASNWYQGNIPGAGARALIPEGISLRYEGESNASLFTVRVDGELSFATDADSRMLLDTMVVSPTGRLEIGTEENPIEAGTDVQIVIANNGDIDTSWDPILLSRGVVSHGEVEIHGAEKDSFLKVQNAPMAGDTQIRLAEVPEGWQVGDTIVLSGTHKEGRQWVNGRSQYVESQDEEVTITAINGRTITIDQPLQYDHDTPRDDLKAYVANMTRNVTFSSEDGESTEVHHRGHTMFMHSDDVDVRYAAFDDLGRTDKSVPANDLDAFATIESDSNIKGRYSFHFHKTGTADQEDPALAIGNTVSGSPGWGFVHHSSHANFTDNVAFEVFGAAFAAEDGDETGIWLRNMAIRSEGVDETVKEYFSEERHDNGRTGDGFFFAGRLVEAAENVAVNTSNGFVYMHRSAPTNPLVDNLHQPELGYGADTIRVNLAPIQGFRDNEAFGTEMGLTVVKDSPSQETDVRSILDGFLNWETAQGALIEYTSHYTLKDFDLLATENVVGLGGPGAGLILGANAFDMVVNGMTVEGFDIGTYLENEFSLGPGLQDSDFDNVLIDVRMIDVNTNYVGFNPARHSILSSDDLTPGRLAFDMRGDTTLSPDETFYFNGIKTDSIGSRDRQFHGDVQMLDGNDIATLLASDGYYRTADGRNVMLIEDFVADRATGELLKFAHVVTLNFSNGQLNALNAPFNGQIDLNSAGPNARDDSFGVNQNQDIILNVLGNDTDPDGDTLRIDGLTNPEHGDLFLQDNGQLLYRPDIDFTGEDTFTYWATDGNGNFESATVTVDVWDI